MSLEAGHKLAHYQILEPIGKVLHRTNAPLESDFWVSLHAEDPVHEQAVRNTSVGVSHGRTTTRGRNALNAVFRI